jgi:uncharacterized membrane protein YhaH (DUF805 family)
MEQMIEKPSLTFSEALNKATNDIFMISGRSRRSEFWWTMGVVYLVNVFLTPFIGTILSLLAIPLKIRRLHDVGKSGWWWGVCAILQTIVVAFFLYDLIILIINDSSSLAQSVIWAFILKYLALWVFILIYKLILFIFYCMDSEPYANKYGDSPKYEMSV